MEPNILTEAANEGREAFFKTVYGHNKGYMCIAYFKPLDKSSWGEQYFQYPNQLPQALQAILELVRGHNVYFCPQLLSERKRTKENVIVTPCGWADLDSCDPDNLFVEPTIVLESSPGRFQAFWSFEGEVDPDDAEDLSRRIAYKHDSEGADRSGWDLTQLLRVPLTYNYKYKDREGVDVPVVKAIHVTRSKYNLSDFESHYPKVSDYQAVEIPLPDELPTDSPEDLLMNRRQELNTKIWQLFTEEPGAGYKLDADGWSKPLWNLQMMLFEAGFNREEVFVIARDAKCNKYARDGKPAHLLWKEVCRAEAKNMANIKVLSEGVKEDSEPPLLTEEERDIVAKQQDTFIERYITWARSLGDAAPQYHQAGAFIALSSLLAGAVRLPTTFGTIIPNLWFMILGDTTITRKSTSMDLAVDLVQEIDDDVVLATDGSLEGLLTSLSTRPGRPGIFLRDEFSGLLESVTKKDYYAGMLEMLTKLYDGKMQKRILRKETIEVREPIFIFFAGGIKDKITSLLTWDHVGSGFLPRFIFITAESDVTKIKPIGPPTDKSTGTGTAIKNELADIHAHYNKTVSITIEKVKAKLQRPRVWNAEMTPDAWIRYNKLETELLETALKSDRPDVMTPTYERLSMSILKAAVLLAASRQRGETILVEEGDILRAMMYGEQWRVHTRTILKSVGKSTDERKLDSVMRLITRTPGITRSKVMQYFHFRAREAEDTFTTLEQRGMIIRKKNGRTENFFAI